MIRNELPQVEDFELYRNVKKCVHEIARNDEWMQNNKKYFDLFGKDRVYRCSYSLTMNERRVIKYLIGDASLEEVGINKLNALRFLRIIKIVDLALKNQERPFMKTVHSTYALRKHILQLCSPEMSSCLAYTMTIDQKKMGDLDYLCQPGNWVHEEVGHQANAIAAHFTRLVSFSKQIEVPVFYAIRGNTGAGKTTLLHEIFKTALDRGEELPVLSLDPLKYFLKKQLKLTNIQVYEEANALFANYLNGVFKQKALRFIFDSRLLTLEYIRQNVISPAMQRGEEVKLIDLDVPLPLSLVRSLVRDPFGKDACVPPDAVEWGYLKIRAEREALITCVRDNPSVTSYKLYHGQTLVAEKKGNGFHIYSGELYEESLRIPAQEEIEACLKTVIDDAFLDKAILQSQIYPSQREALAKWRGKTVGEALKAHAYQIPDRPAPVIPPDGVRFVVPCDDILMAKYEEFYKKMAIKLIAADLEKLNGQWSISPDGKTIHVEKLPYYHPDKHLFVAIPIVLREEEKLQTITLSSRVNLATDGYFYTDLIPYAKEHEDPVRFLLDHYRFWSFRMDEVVEFLDDHTTYYGVMDIFEKILDERKVADSIWAAFGKALKEPTLRQRAEELLFKHDRLSPLAPYLHEKRIKDRFEEIVRSHPNFSLSFAALAYLEKTEPIRHELKVDICREILSSNKGNYSFIQEVLWLMPDQGYEALDRDITCEEKSPALYSILKYIAIKTKDRSEFDSIVKRLIAFKDLDSHESERLETTLCHIKFYNPRFELPQGVAVSDNPPGRKELPRSPISSIYSKEGDYRRWWQSYNALLDKAIRNPELSVEKRVVALRELAKDLFIKEGYISESQHGKRALANAALPALLANPETPERLRFEASRIQEWLQSHD